jgi:pimeloyl-ACP methyl ester carboxylesterase
MAPQSPEKDRWATWFYYSQGSEAFRGDLYFYSVEHDLRGKLDQIDGGRCPVIILNGEYDYLTTPEDGKRTAEQIRGAEFIEMKGIGHFPMSENYPLFKEYLQQALQTIENLESMLGTRAGGETRAGEEQSGEQDKGLVAKAKDKLTPG